MHGLDRAKVVHDGMGGPGNPLSTTKEQLARSYRDALDGCPDPAVVAVCAAGAAGTVGRERVERVVRERFPAAMIVVAPDYIAALLASGRDGGVVVVAGTGSVVCSRSADGEARVSGGHGWIIGDHGSAARLGRLVLDRHCVAAAAAAALADEGMLAAGIEEVYGTSEPRRLVSALHASDTPAAFLARAAPLLTGAAARADRWAVQALDWQMGALAGTTSAHLDHWSHPAARIALAGGVWSSPAARRSFERALARQTPGATVVAGTLSPIEGAVALAREHLERP